MAHTTFGQRFAYARWLFHLKTGAEPTHKSVAEAVGRSAPAVGAWIYADDPPPHYLTHGPLAEFFGVDERWLIRGEGQPPKPELWKAWAEARGYGAKSDDAQSHSPPRGAKMEPPPIPAERPSTKKKDRSA